MSMAIIARLQAAEERIAALEQRISKYEGDLDTIEQGMIREVDEPFPVEKLEMPKVLKRLLQKEDAS